MDPTTLDDLGDYSNGTQTFNSTDELAVIGPKRSYHEITISAFVLMIIILTALSGNIAVIYAIMTTPKLREHNSNLFIINLSVTDMSSAVVVMCTAFVMLAGDYRHVNQVWCDICCAANYILIIVSMLTLAFISIDRYFAVIHALTYTLRITKERVLLMIAWAWIQGAIFGFAPVIKKWVHYDYWEVVCAIAWQEEKPQSIYYVICAFIICFGIPGFIMLLCYISIIKEARRCRTGPAGVSIPKGQRSATKTIRSLLIVVALFFICMTPFCVTKLLKVIFADPMYIPPYANLVASYMGYMSCVINPFIYAIFRADFRAAYKLLWWRMSCKCFGSQLVPPAPPSSFFTKTDRVRNSIYSITNRQPSPSARRLLSPHRKESPSPVVNDAFEHINNPQKSLALNCNSLDKVTASKSQNDKHPPRENYQIDRPNTSKSLNKKLDFSQNETCYINDLEGSTYNLSVIEV